MWATLRASPRFQALLQQRQGSGDAQQLAAVLAAASPGRAPSVWRELQAAAAAGSLPRLLLVAGQEDGKFVGVAERLAASLTPAGDKEGPAGAAAAKVALVPGCGHAVHIERPAELLQLLQRFSSQCDSFSL
jgi:isochorismate synthase/2-succinyl-5-enolpyruvyl-6-hydroxy-3-cyclohexene-1-carboxylate synthase/2-succinyl-6-hydroxy-2,4-cyclohexadiene-1-carboxylate synthase/O-succinylbenzoate synthase